MGRITAIIRRPATALALLLAALLAAASAGRAEESPMHEQTNASGSSRGSFSHDDWTTVLERFVDADGMVDYEGLYRDRAVFDRYVEAIETASPMATPQRFPSRQDALAYYINAYNAQVFAGVLARGPEKKSVWRGLISGFNFFGRMKVTIGGESMNLKSLEEKIVLSEFRDPRVHAALNCASIGCPRLLREAYVPERLDEQLDAAMREWVNDPHHVKIDPASKTVRLNKIFDWFAADFIGFEKREGTADPSQIDYINRFRQVEDRIPRDYSIAFLPYDKGINAQ